MFTNGSKLLATKSSKDTLTCLDGIRFLSICWIVVGHRFMLSLEEPSINAVDGYGVSSFSQVEEDLKYIRLYEF
jgi:peptidoglycan/LPS O-acetylase OafA/YrhL